MLQWDCPLCQLHPSFDTREMLRFHLQCDHAEVQVLWRGIERNGKQTWQIVLTVSDIDDGDSSEDEEDDESDLDSQVPGQVPLKEEDEEDELDELLSTPSRTPRPTPSSAAEVDEVDEALRMSGSISVASPLPMIQPELLSPEPPVFIPKKFRAESPTPATAPRARRIVQPSRGSLPERYPTPPPPDDLLGPSAQYPYLLDGANAEEYYSCRPGGSRIYDLLNALSLEPFGVLSWVIVDREEELFEMDDIRDENKVMMALWNKWIMLNRTEFIMEPYRDSIVKFVDQYWRMIHRAAGWAALRSFLLMLAANRFLKASEIVEILKHYETYTGMDQWYKDHDAEA
ncbi:uncharacterized protein LAESUDRAFT_386888 [Laetiporus sulphureus 93-53]|uniref:Uncharacterized protein n=1 Tax=Laetiporus sulphureus 93-53 TaxID=1314785 RepID=A0A165CJB1_9APHY|nr:uncharacterized protein LAESUDRAFT_386888 [Laetiporus sulphureus 93-53]KZT02913.1 hypothetical protein LAESUDRAFT_386888 [Laetiporus sulphureus 93-53]